MFPTQEIPCRFQLELKGSDFWKTSIKSCLSFLPAYSRKTSMTTLHGLHFILCQWLCPHRKTSVRSLWGCVFCLLLYSHGLAPYLEHSIDAHNCVLIPVRDSQVSSGHQSEVAHLPSCFHSEKSGVLPTSFSYTMVTSQYNQWSAHWSPSNRGEAEELSLNNMYQDLNSAHFTYMYFLSRVSWARLWSLCGW